MFSRVRSTAAIAAFLVVAGLSIAGARATLQQAGAALAELKLTEPAAQDAFFSSLWDFYPVIPGGREAFKAVSGEKRAAIIRGLGSFVRTYTQTDAFRQRYAAAREANRPQPRQPQQSMEEMDREQDAALAEMEANIKSMPPEMREQMEQTVKELKAQQAELRKDKELRAVMEDSINQQQIADQVAYKQDLEEYERSYPANPGAMIAERLRTFLEVCEGVDFEAKLVKQGSMVRFADRQYESKGPEWKLCYRAGKEATEAARAFAAEWLKTLRSGS